MIAVLFIAFAAVSFIQDNKGIAKVQRVQGYYIYAMSEPVTDYDVIGTVKGKTVGSHEFDKLLEQVVKNVQKDYPDADGILFDGAIKQSHNTKVSVIKFK